MSSSVRVSLVLVRIVETGRFHYIADCAICTMPISGRRARSLPPALAVAPNAGTMVGCCDSGSFAYIPDASDNWLLCEISPLVN